MEERNGGGWSEVRRRKQVRNYHQSNIITNIYVSGFPGDTRKDELRRSFTRFGNVVDVYMGRKKDSHQRNFVFVRFKGIKDDKMTSRSNFFTHEAPPHPPHPPPQHNSEYRTFAQVAAGIKDNPLPPIPLNSKTSMGEWIQKTVLFGDAHSLDHIGNLPTLSIGYVSTKYLGGIQMALCFDHSVEADEFLNDKARWRDWFTRLYRGDQQEIKYERTTWLKILGLSLRLWDEDNFSTIASLFGRVIYPFDGIHNRRDYSMVEYTDDWSPFKRLPFDNVKEYSDEENVDDEEEDDDGILDTWIQEVNNELEDGEIRTDDNHQQIGLEAVRSTISDRNDGTDSSDKATGVDNSFTMIVPPTTSPVPILIPTVEVGVALNTTSNVPHMSPTFYIPQTLENTTRVKVINLEQNTFSFAPPPNQSFTLDQTPSKPHFFEFGSSTLLVPTGCFGPFPLSNKSPRDFTPTHTKHSTQNSGSNGGGPKSKRRKRNKSCSCSSPTFTDHSLFSPAAQMGASSQTQPINLNDVPHSTSNSTSATSSSGVDGSPS
ncbi:unnamed protein product [Lactuca saligna]|uniref:RRM domain-containing protein n=1 Tax=Lactuca saligna TaxID=75948 RepID=A0AA35ZZU5_LACSI|nr:unnamed protein product [Lactuca saligna]